MNSEPPTVTRRGGCWRWAVFAVALLTLAACGGGGGDATPGVMPGPPPPGTSAPPAPARPSTTMSVGAITATSVVTSEMLSVSLASPPTVTFSLQVDGFMEVDDLALANVRFSLARLVAGTEPGTLVWQSLINTREDPVCRRQADVDSTNNDCTTFTTATDPAMIPDTALKVQDAVAGGRVAVTQATTERSGTLTRNTDGTWRYTLATDPGAPGSLNNVHRVCLQFSLPAAVGNPCIDFVPSEVVAAADGVSGTSLQSGFHAAHVSAQVVATESCNSCHDALALHGGGRTEMDYCVTCHNPGSTDANSGNSVDFKVLIHRLHRGHDLPSVVAGTPYKIWGFRNSEHDYSHVHFPQRVANCTRCHAGAEDVAAAAADGLPAPRAVVTADGYNWATRPSASACVSCHDNPDHIASESPDCSECHIEGGEAGSIEGAHRDLARLAARDFRFEILDVTDGGPGSMPVIDFRVVNPNAGDAAYDIVNDEPFQFDGDSTLRLTVGWSTTDYTNTRAGIENTRAVSIDALQAPVVVGDGVFRVTSPVAIPDGTQAPFIAARGSGAVTMEGHPAAELVPEHADEHEHEAEIVRLPVTSTVRYFSIDEPDGQARPRRQVVAVERCQACHETLSHHGSNRTDSVEVCVTCHNPRGTDRGVRLVAVDPPTDGKAEESVHFKTMIHGIHASAKRTNPLQVVGSRGRRTHVFDEEEVQFPGRLANCTTCHVDASYALPLPGSALGTTVATGADRADPTDDTVVSPVAATCSACHDDPVAIAHMSSNGGSFSTTQAALDSGQVVEACEVCHRAGAIADVRAVHELP